MAAVAALKAMPREMFLYFFYKAISQDIQICFTVCAGHGATVVKRPFLDWDLSRFLFPSLSRDLLFLCPVHFVLVYFEGSVRCWDFSVPVFCSVFFGFGFPL